MSLSKILLLATLCGAYNISHSEDLSTRWAEKKLFLLGTPQTPISIAQSIEANGFELIRPNAQSTGVAPVTMLGLRVTTGHSKKICDKQPSVRYFDRIEWELVRLDTHKTIQRWQTKGWNGQCGEQRNAFAHLSSKVLTWWNNGRVEKPAKKKHPERVAHKNSRPQIQPSR